MAMFFGGSLDAVITFVGAISSGRTTLGVAGSAAGATFVVGEVSAGGADGAGFAVAGAAVAGAACAGTVLWGVGRGGWFAVICCLRRT